MLDSNFKAGMFRPASSSLFRSFIITVGGPFIFDSLLILLGRQLGMRCYSILLYIVLPPTE